MVAFMFFHDSMIECPVVLGHVLARCVLHGPPFAMNICCKLVRSDTRQVVDRFLADQLLGCFG